MSRGVCSEQMKCDVQMNEMWLEDPTRWWRVGLQALISVKPSGEAQGGSWVSRATLSTDLINLITQDDYTCPEKCTSWIQKLCPLDCEGGGGNGNNINGQTFGSGASFGLFQFFEDKVEFLPSKSSRSGWWTVCMVCWVHRLYIEIIKLKSILNFCPKYLWDKIRCSFSVWKILNSKIRK